MIRSFGSRVALLLSALVLTSCASTSISNRGERNEIDPFETYNRAMFGFNDAADRIVFKPIATVYDKVTPELFRYMIGNVFSNLDEINNGVNNLLQGKFRAALSDGTRFFVNTTLGFGGLAEVASELGLQRNNEDFGQTLGVWGVSAGPYFVLPFLGPTSGRDLGGFFVGSQLYPLNYLDPKSHRGTLNILQQVDNRANLLGASRLIDGAALDRYTFVRNAYFQRRLSLVYDGDPPFHKVPAEENGGSKSTPESSQAPK